jgi:hypothetical protein
MLVLVHIPHCGAQGAHPVPANAEGCDPPGRLEGEAAVSRDRVVPGRFVRPPVPAPPRVGGADPLSSCPTPCGRAMVLNRDAVPPRQHPTSRKTPVRSMTASSASDSAAAAEEVLCAC